MQMQTARHIIPTFAIQPMELQHLLTNCSGYMVVFILRYLLQQVAPRIAKASTSYFFRSKNGLAIGSL
jgi:hypothetical protein